MDCTRLRSVWSRRNLLLAGMGLRGQNWMSLFDGVSTAGWMAVAGRAFPGDSWVVADGCLKSLVRTPTFQDIRTVREFGDFELSFEWKIAAGGNGGVKYLISKYDSWLPKGVVSGPPHARARGLEYQLSDDTKTTDATKRTGALYSRMAATGAPLREAGLFNESRIVARRPVVEHWLNGKRILTARLTEELPALSAIALQNHSAECWFRALRVREL